MTLLSAILLLLVAAPGFQKPEFMTSHSGQFIIHGQGPVTPVPVVLSGSDRPVEIDLEPQLAAIAAERIKRGLLDTLRISDQYRDKIHIILIERPRPDQLIGMISTSYTDGWKYEVIIPARVESTKFAKAIVQALLLELANRNSSRSAELPSWLIEGLTQEIISAALPTYVLGQKVVTREILGFDQLISARSYFKTNSCLTFQQLSFARVDWANRQEARLYQNSAHLLVHEILKLSEGPGLLAAFVASLPNALNWQTMFLRVYRQHFPRMLDIEKWWTLVWIDFKNREAHELWPLDVSAQKLRSALLTSIEVSAYTNSLPQRQEVPLAVVLERATFSTQKEILAQKLQQLFFLSFTLAPDAAVIAAKYRAAIQEYLEKRVAADVQPSLKMDPEKRNQLLAREAGRAFAELDSQLQTFQAIHVEQPPATVQETRIKRTRSK
jgi:hypothetical protein